MIVDKTKQYTTRDGRPVRIYATDHKGEYPVHGAVEGAGGWKDESWAMNGSYWADSGQADNLDLVEAPPQHSRWIIVNSAYGYSTKQEAVGAFGRYGRLKGSAIVQVTWREGDGL